jgi:hypothetical protein
VPLATLGWASATEVLCASLLSAGATQLPGGGSPVVPGLRVEVFCQLPGGGSLGARPGAFLGTGGC